MWEHPCDEENRAIMTRALDPAHQRGDALRGTSSPDAALDDSIGAKAKVVLAPLGRSKPTARSWMTRHLCFGSASE